MDSPEAILYLQKIEELVYDNGDIITPTVLSTQLNVKVSEASCLIEQYVRDTRQLKADDLGVTYVLIGIDRDGNLSIGVVKEADLQERKSQLKTVISQRVYSVQKSKDVELNSLAILESIGTLSIREKPLPGCIVSPNAIKRQLKTKPSQPPPAVKNEPEEKPTFKTDTKVNNNKAKQKNGGISSFLSKDVSKQPSKSAFETKPKPKNFMANFLAQPSHKTTSTNNKIEETVKREDIFKEETKIDVISIKDKENILKDSKTEEKQKYKLIDSDSDENVPPPKKTKQTPKPKSKKKRNLKDKGNQAPKRRRIISQDNSDSDDIFESDNDKVEEDEDIVVSDDEVPPPKQLLPFKRKVRKTVSETIMDDDGYLKTVNKYVYETVSGDEDSEDQKDVKNIELKEDEENKEQKPNNSVQPNAQNGNNKKKNIPSPKAGSNTKAKGHKPPQNQASIMNFFKKK